MRFSQFICTLAILPLAACATVNLEDVTPAAQQAETPSVQNVVLRASKALVTAFEKQGWSEAEPSGKMQTAAKFLLKGMGSKMAKPKATYASLTKSPQALKSDVVKASVHVEDLLKAAEVYLAMSENDDDLRPELQSLEKALSACYKAELNFKQSAEKFDNVEVTENIQALQTVVLRLRDVADIYGDRVRAQSVVSFEAAS